MEENIWENSIEQDEDDVPWADPQIRLEYESALGEFILAFNEVDYRLTAAIRHYLRKLNIEGLLDCLVGRDFSQRVFVFDSLQKQANSQFTAPIESKRLSELGGERNIVAHGHFDQNPFDGSYELANSSYKKHLKRIVQNVSTVRLRELTILAKKLGGELRELEIWETLVLEDDSNGS